MGRWGRDRGLKPAATMAPVPSMAKPPDGGSNALMEEPSLPWNPAARGPALPWRGGRRAAHGARLPVAEWAEAGISFTARSTAPSRSRGGRRDAAPW